MVVDDPNHSTDAPEGPRALARQTRLVGLVRRAVPAVALIAPLAVAAAWIPVRTKLPNTDLALVLVALAAFVGASGRRAAVILCAFSAALSFEYFDTVPFDRLAISRDPDLATTLVLAVVATMSGQLALWRTRHRAAMRKESEELTSLRITAELVASGEELVGVIEAVGEELQSLLSLDAWRFEGAGHGSRAEITRNGTISSRPRPNNGSDDPLTVALPIVVQGEVLGSFLLGFGVDSATDPDRLLVAVALADQVGAAFLAQAPPNPSEPEPLRGLYVVSTDDTPASPLDAPAGHEPAGRSCAGDRLIS